MKEKQYTQQGLSIPFHFMQMLRDEQVERGDGQRQMKGKA